MGDPMLVLGVNALSFDPGPTQSLEIDGVVGMMKFRF